MHAQATGAATNGAPSTSTLDRKRKAEPSADAAPDMKRPTFSAGQGARPTRSNTTGTGAVAGGRTSVQQATSARTGPSQVTGGGSELGPIAEESWDDIHDRTGQGVDDVLNKKLGFPKGTKPERKVEAFVPFVKELKWVHHDEHTPGWLPYTRCFGIARTHPNRPYAPVLVARVTSMYPQVALCTRAAGPWGGTCTAPTSGWSLTWSSGSATARSCQSRPRRSGKNGLPSRRLLGSRCRRLRSCWSCRCVDSRERLNQGFVEVNMSCRTVQHLCVPGDHRRPVPLNLPPAAARTQQEQQNKQLESDIKEGEDKLRTKEVELTALQLRLDGVQADLERTTKQLEEREGKVRLWGAGPKRSAEPT